MTAARNEAQAPRWEWRTFAPDLAEVRRRLPGLGKVQAKRSRETCIVSALVPHATSICAERLEVRRLVQVDGRGLELWAPVLQAMFPVPADDVARLYALWRVARPPFTQDYYSLTLFMEDLVRRSVDLHVADVEKTRYELVCARCPGEFAEVALNGVPLQSVGFAHEEPAVVLRAMTELGVSDVRNVSGVQAIKEALGLAALPASA